MTTAYNAHRVKQQKGKTSRQQKDPNEPQALLDTVNKTMRKLQSLDTSAWTNDERGLHNGIFW